MMDKTRYILWVSSNELKLTLKSKSYLAIEFIDKDMFIPAARIDL